MYVCVCVCVYIYIYICNGTGLPWRLSGKESPYTAGDMGSVSGSRRSNGEGNGNHSSILTR